MRVMTNLESTVLGVCGRVTDSECCMQGRVVGLVMHFAARATCKGEGYV